MTGYNMPPGVNESDIPGNRPEDLALDSLTDQIDDLIVAAIARGLASADVVEMLRRMVEDYDTGGEQY